MLVASALLLLMPLSPVESDLSFNRDIRPILSDRCWQCHGPDSAARKVGLRLDTFEDATAERRGGAAIVPGDPESSLLLRRIEAHDPDDRMPPVELQKPVTPDEAALLRQWIARGAAWERHWSFIAPARPAVPAPSAAPGTRGQAVHPIDAFIRARLEEEGLAPSPPADRATLIRRLYLDLVGLPPAPEDVDAFDADTRPDAYERLVQRLLETDAHAEHFARTWLDAARYGDTHGLHLDNRRSMWPWRDWVIDAYRSNKPFDEFVIEQVAGDLLPDATLEQRIASGFNRNNVTTSEGGAIAEEYRVKYAVDRVNTLSTVFLGLTAECAQCHDHKFDPITQREYFGLFAYYANTADPAMDGNRPDTPPVVLAPTEAQEAELAAMDAEIAALEASLAAPMPEADAAQAAWTQAWRSGADERWETLRPADATAGGGTTLRVLEDDSILAEGDNPAQDEYRITARTDRTDLRVLRIEALTHDALPHGGPGRADNANFVLSEVTVEAASLGDPESRTPVRLVVAAADHEQANGGYLAAKAIDGVIDGTNGWAVEGYNRRENRQLVLVSDAPFGFDGGTELVVTLKFATQFAQHGIGRVRLAASDDAMLTDLLAPARFGPWFAAGPFGAEDGHAAYRLSLGPEAALSTDAPAVDLAATYGDDDLAWTERPEFRDGAIHTLEGASCATYLYRTIRAETDRMVELSIGSDDGIRIWLNGHVVHDNMVARPVAADQDRVTLHVPAGASHLLMKVVNLAGGYGFYFRSETTDSGREFMRIAGLLERPEDELDDASRSLVRSFYRRHHAPEYRRISDAMRTRTAERDAFRAQLPTTLVMAERPEPRMTYLLERGEYDRPVGDPIEPSVPACLPPMPSDAPASRLGLAQWLVMPSHPLTARVTVNRTWQQFFGTGLVATSGDFGAQGAWPSHPDLLDWLAVELVESGWDMRHMVRLMVSSATYRQSSRVEPVHLQRDPANRLLARGPRFRLDAEVIRDQALAASGLLVPTVGGPSVRPYQPEGLWKAVGYPDSDTAVFRMGEGDAHHRRSMYTFWKRTSPPPNLAAFDAPNRENCTVLRPRTNTPMQALVLLNDPQFVEMARHLGARALRETDRPEAAVQRAFRLVLGRRPSPADSRVLLRLFEQHRATYTDDPAAAEALLAVGFSPRDPELDPADHAAMTNVAGAILALDEAVTKG